MNLSPSTFEIRASTHVSKSKRFQGYFWQRIVDFYRIMEIGNFMTVRRALNSRECFLGLPANNTITRPPGGISSRFLAGYRFQRFDFTATTIRKAVRVHVDSRKRIRVVVRHTLASRPSVGSYAVSPPDVPFGAKTFSLSRPSCL